MSHNNYVHEPELNTARESQDALRHAEDARHNKQHKTPLPGEPVDENTVRQQPEIQKVGSRDAPGG